MIEWQGEIPLEENSEVINVEPRFSFDEDGGIVVADEDEQQLRHYDSHGRLQGAYGSEGEGPGEFTQPVAAVRLPDGDIFGADWSGRYSRFAPDGELVSSGRLPLRRITDLLVLSDDELLIAGTHPEQRVGERLHVVDLSDYRIERSFLRPPERQPTSPLSASVDDERIAAVYGLSDSVYVFDRTGNLERKVQIPGEHFRPYADPRSWPPEPEWFRSFTFAFDVAWLPDGSLLVQYYRITESDPEYTLLRMDLERRRRFELVGTPKFLGTTADAERLVFLSPDVGAPNRLAVARLRRPQSGSERK